MCICTEIEIYFVEVTCSALEIPKNGQVSYDRDPTNEVQNPMDTTATFMCNPGFSLVGDFSTICQTSGSWSQQTPTCISNEI